MLSRMRPKGFHNWRILAPAVVGAVLRRQAEDAQSPECPGTA